LPPPFQNQWHVRAGTSFFPPPFFHYRSWSCKPFCFQSPPRWWVVFVLTLRFLFNPLVLCVYLCLFSLFVTWGPPPPFSVWGTVPFPRSRRCPWNFPLRDLVFFAVRPLRGDSTITPFFSLPAWFAVLCVGPGLFGFRFWKKF